jgi:hypothetical protein
VTALVYVYAILADMPLRLKLRGINGQPVRWVTSDEGLTAAVSDVPQAEFDEEPLNAGVSDMQWLAPRAVAHQDVNQQLSDALEAVIPLSFGTVFRDDARVQHMLREQRQQLGERLARVRERHEFVVDVRLTSQPDPQTSPALQALQAEIDAASPGRAHLLKQRYTALEREELRRLETDAAEHVLDALRRLAVDVFVEPLPSEVEDRPLVRASVLVERAAGDRFIDALDALHTQWYRVLVTGPWPPYRFGGLEHAAATH